MKTKNDNLESTPQKTALEAAMDEHRQAQRDLAEHRASISRLRARAAELETAIAIVQAKAAESPKFASLTVEQIKSMATARQGVMAELEALRGASESAQRELHSLNREEAGFRFSVSDTRSAIWAALFDDLVAMLPEGLLTQIATAAVSCGMTEVEIAERLGLVWSEKVADELSQKLGVVQ